MLEWLYNNLVNVSIVAIISGALGFAISVYTLYLKRRKVVTNAISSNRMQWIARVRDLMYEFIEAYINNESKEKKQLKKIQLELYVREAECYENFIAALEKCTNEGYTEQGCKALVNECQVVLHDVWVRIKREAGINKMQDRKIENEIKKEK